MRKNSVSWIEYNLGRLSLLDIINFNLANLVCYTCGDLIVTAVRWWNLYTSTSLEQKVTGKPLVAPAAFFPVTYPHTQVQYQGRCFRTKQGLFCRLATLFCTKESHLELTVQICFQVSVSQISTTLKCVEIKKGIN